MQKSLSILVLGICFLWTPYGLGEAFQPETSPSLADPSSWRELEPLREYKLVSGAESLDGTLYFASDDFLIAFDGYQSTEYRFPEKYEDLRLFELFASKNGLIYTLSSHGLFSFKEGVFELVIETSTGSKANRGHFTTGPYGTEIAIVGNKVYQVDGYEFKHVHQIEGDIAAAAFDHNNRLWALVPFANAFETYQFDRTSIALPLVRKDYDLTPGDSRVFFPKPIASPDYKGVWAVNWPSLQHSHRYSEETDTWLPFDLSDIIGNNAHITGFIPGEDELVIFTKASLLYYSNHKWHVLRAPEFSPPTNAPFHIQRRNGNIILSGYGEKTYEVLYSKNNYTHYTGLHFQTDGNDSSQWFLSVEGEVIEHRSLEGSWQRHTENVIDTPLVIAYAQDGTIWVTGAHKEQAALCYYDGHSWTRRSHPELGKFFSHLSAFQLSDDTMIFGSGTELLSTPPGGAVTYRKTENGYQVNHYHLPIVPERPVAFAKTKDGTLWTGGKDLYRIDSNLTQHFQLAPPFDRERWVDHLTNDQQGNLWVALWEKGLFRFDGETWTRIESPHQIASDQVSAVLSDSHVHNGLWAATDKGISRFDGHYWHPLALPKTVRLSREGGTLKQANDGGIWINLAARNWFFRKTSNFRITKDLYDSFRTIRHKLDTEAPIANIVSPTFEHTSPANIFVEWEGIDRWSHTPSEQLRFSHKIGDEDWSNFTSDKSKIFLDIASGEHSIQVRAMDLDGNISSQPASILVAVTPPMWQRAWFMAAVGFTLLIIALLIVFIFKQRIRHIVKMEEFKLQFFTNISHELRTPLTVILGPLESHLSKMRPEEDKKPLELAYKNARKTLKLIDQLLDFRSAQTNKISLNLAHSDLVASVRESIDLIRPLAEDQSQSIQLHCDTDFCLAWFDSEKLDRILNNLVSNAIKYTEKGGSISIQLSLEETEKDLIAAITVEDNGSGIPSGKIDNIFEVFYRAGSHSKKNVRGSGIGLAYTKNLVEAFSGNIKVESPITQFNGKKQGTRFTVTLPFDKYLQNESEGIAASAIEPSADSPQARSKPSLLIAEDDTDIRDFIAGELIETYEIATAENGEIALKTAQSLLPDIIITDVMMPQMDGKELCRRLKNEPLTSHIPVIMLTALKSDHHELEGLEHGADDYLSKPIRIPILKQRIRNQLDTLKAQHKRFEVLAKKAGYSLKRITGNPLDEKLLESAIAYIEKKIEDPLLDVESLAQNLGMSRMTLYRKTKAITGESPSQFIRSIRMQRAIELLESKEHTVSEIGYKVGFSDLSSFSATFKKQIGCSPSEYLQSSKED